MTTFTDLGLAAPILAALAEEGYNTPTPIQAQAIPLLLAGRDLMGIAQTGTGKTAAFSLPILHRLAAENVKVAPRTCRTLILSPTRELAGQIADSIRSYSRHLKLSVAVVYGGVSAGPQAQTLQRGVDILVATPGRLLDHMSTGVLRLDGVRVLVLDEADQMLDMGFIHAIRRVVRALPKDRQSLFFSATMPREIATLAGEMLNNPERVAVTPVSTTAERIAQRVIHVETAQKRNELAHVLANETDGRTLVFTRTKHGADRVVKHLEQVGLTAAAIHGNKSQGQRQRALDGFKDGSTRILVATDIAARGIDVDGVTHVVNFDLPQVAETYVHRIGRTARAGASGSAISFCASDERQLLTAIERLTRQSIPVTPRGSSGADAPPDPPQQHRRGGQAQGRPQQGRQQDGRQQAPAKGRGQGQGRGGHGGNDAGRHHAAGHAGGRPAGQGNAQQRRPARPQSSASEAQGQGNGNGQGHGGEIAQVQFMRPASPRSGGNRRG